MSADHEREEKFLVKIDETDETDRIQERICISFIDFKLSSGPDQEGGQGIRKKT